MYGGYADDHNLGWNPVRLSANLMNETAWPPVELSSFLNMGLFFDLNKKCICNYTF